MRKMCFPLIIRIINRTKVILTTSNCRSFWTKHSWSCFCLPTFVLSQGRYALLVVFRSVVVPILVVRSPNFTTKNVPHHVRTSTEQLPHYPTNFFHEISPRTIRSLLGGKPIILCRIEVNSVSMLEDESMRGIPAMEKGWSLRHFSLKLTVRCNISQVFLNTEPKESMHVFLDKQTNIGRVCRLRSDDDQILEGVAEIVT